MDSEKGRPAENLTEVRRGVTAKFPQQPVRVLTETFGQPVHRILSVTQFERDSELGAMLKQCPGDFGLLEPAHRIGLGILTTRPLRSPSREFVCMFGSNLCAGLFVGYAYKSRGLTRRGFSGVIRRFPQRKSGDFSAHVATKRSVTMLYMPSTNTPTLEHGKTYRIRTRRRSFRAVVEGPVSDGTSEFYIICSPFGDFDVESGEGGTWDAGKSIGWVQIREL
jgi:hypothetical protein